MKDMTVDDFLGAGFMESDVDDGVHCFFPLD